MKTRRERKENFAALISEPEAFEIICEDISDGTTLSDVARRMEANFMWLHSWIHDDMFPERAERLMVALNARDALTKEDVIGQLHRIANIDIRDAFDEHGNLLSVQNLPESVAKAIASIDVSTNEAGDIMKKVRFVDKSQMLALSGRRQRMFVDKVEVTGQMTLEQAVMESVKPRE